MLSDYYAKEGLNHSLRQSVVLSAGCRVLEKIYNLIYAFGDLHLLAMFKTLVILCEKFPFEVDDDLQILRHHRIHAHYNSAE